MISFLRGTIIQKNSDSIVLDVQGVGYLVYIPQNEINKFILKKEASFFTYLSVRENALDLYGSSHALVIKWFKMLLNVKGVGPKSALSILSHAQPEDLSVAISSSSSDILINCGVSKKISESIVLELKNKAKDLIDIKDGASAKSVSIDSEALSALEALGYSREQARDAIKHSEGKDVEAKIRGALKNLGK